jgi:hypothetical protein
LLARPVRAQSKKNGLRIKQDQEEEVDRKGRFSEKLKGSAMA